MGKLRVAMWGAELKRKTVSYIRVMQMEMHMEMEPTEDFMVAKPLLSLPMGPVRTEGPTA